MRPISHAVQGALVELLRAVPLSPGKARFVWSAVVGPAMDRATSVRLERDALIVETISAPWAREVTRLSGTILARMQTLVGAGAIARIDVRVARTPEP